jgi:hypothetical protein
MSSIFAAPLTYPGAARRCCSAGARSDRNAKQSIESGSERFSALKRFLRHGIKLHDDAVAEPGKQFMRVVPRDIVEKGSRDIEAERQRAHKFSAVLRIKVQRHDDAIAASGRRIKTLPTVKGLVDKGMQDIQTVASRTRPEAPLSEYSDVWTFPIALVTYSTVVIAWAAELAGSFVLVSASCIVLWWSKTLRVLVTKFKIVKSTE